MDIILLLRKASATAADQLINGPARPSYTLRKLT